MNRTPVALGTHLAPGSGVNLRTEVLWKKDMRESTMEARVEYGKKQSLRGLRRSVNGIKNDGRHDL
jgi:hypothetical protein